MDATEAWVAGKLGGDAGAEDGEVYGAAKADGDDDVYGFHEPCSGAQGLLLRCRRGRGIVRRRPFGHC